MNQKEFEKYEKKLKDLFLCTKEKLPEKQKQEIWEYICYLWGKDEEKKK